MNRLDVRQLEWFPHLEHCAVSTCKRYFIDYRGVEPNFLLYGQRPALRPYGNSGFLHAHETIEEAKDAAQKNLERLIAYDLGMLELQ